MNATLGDIEFVGDGGPATFTLGRSGLVGWFEGVDTQGEQIPRQNADGDYDMPLYRTARLITVSGMVLAQSSDTDFEVSLNQLAAIPTRTLTLFTVTSDAGATSAYVRRVGKPDLSVNSFGLSASYQLRLLAPDPRRYGTMHDSTSGTSATVTHAGNGDARPVIDVTGTMSAGYTISDGTRSYVVTQALTSGHTHTIDMATGLLSLDGVVQVGAVTTAQLFVVPAGTSVAVTLTPVSGSGSMVVHTTDTYI